MKATAIAPSNIAFIKYWGKKDEKLRIPENGSISVNLSNLNTTTTVEFSSQLIHDSVTINDMMDRKQGERVITHLNRIRKLTNIKLYTRVVSKNNFPASSGLASSASSFAALTLAGSSAAGLNLSEKELSILARLGSGSACRSIPDGYVEWLDGKTSETSYALSIFPPDYWDINIIVVVVSEESKDISTTEGHALTAKNHFMPIRIAMMNEKIKQIKKFIKEKKFPQFGDLVEKEALELHAIALTSNPPIIYWQPATVSIMKLVQTLRKEGLAVYFTIDAGPNICLICEKKNVKKLTGRLKNIYGIKNTIVNYPSVGARLIKRHLF